MKLNASAKNLIDKLKKNDVETIAAQERQKRQNETPPKFYITDCFSQANLLKPAVVVYIQLSIDTAYKIVSSLNTGNCLICFSDAAKLEKTKRALDIKSGYLSVSSYLKRQEDWVTIPIFDKNGDIVKFWKIF